MLAIKFRPVGKKKQRSFRVVVAEKRSKLQGRFVEDLGWYNPHNDQYSLNEERVKYWIGTGAQPTDGVHNLLVRAGILPGPKRPVHSSRKKEEKSAGGEGAVSIAEAKDSKPETLKTDIPKNQTS